MIGRAKPSKNVNGQEVCTNEWTNAKQPRQKRQVNTKNNTIMKTVKPEKSKAASHSLTVATLGALAMVVGR